MRARATFFSIIFNLTFWILESPAQHPAIKLSTGGEVQPHTLIFSGSQLMFQGQIESLELFPVKDELFPVKGRMNFVSIKIPGYFLTGETGTPSLPQKTMLFEADDGEATRISIIRLDSVIFDLSQLDLDAKILPAFPSVRKRFSSEDYQLDSTVYKTDGWLGGPIVTVTYEGIMRGLPMSTLHFNPVQYNPVRNLLKVYYNVSCSIEIAEGKSQNYIPSEAFEGLFKRVIRRSEPGDKKAVFSEEPMTLVILSDTLFRKKLQPFIQWKSQKGFKVVEAYKHEPRVGSTRESMKAFLEALYKQPAKGMSPPTYLLIVGDVEQIPLSQAAGQITDLYYATYDGVEDYIPDLFYGRISVATNEQLQVVLDKILEYEQYQFPDPSFLDEAVLIAGVDGTFASRHGNGQINYANDYYLNESRNINAHIFLYPESDTSDKQILELISRGVGFVNYTGHGLYDRWINPTFHQNDIDDLNNLGKYPVMIGNGCETNVFNLDECFAEALLRAPERGALAYIGCTNDSYWDEDYFWAVGVGPIVAEPVYEESAHGYYDKVFHTHGETRAIWTPSLGEMIFGGNMSVQQSNSSRKKFYWEIYQLAGDPSIIPWFSQPGLRDVTYPDVLPVGTSRMDLTCAPFDYVALSHNGILLDANHASAEGYATLHLPDTLMGGTLDLVVSGEPYIPFVGEVMMGVPPDAYLDLLVVDLSSESVEEDGFISVNEQFSLDMHWINRGETDLVNDTLVLFIDHQEMILMDSLVAIERIDAGDTVFIQNVFRIRSGPTMVDQDYVMLGFYWKGDPEGHRVYLTEKINAPTLVSGGIRWDDRPLGNGNGITEQGEWLTCTWTIHNQGHFRTGEMTGIELPIGLSLIEQIEFDTLPPLEPGDSLHLSFRARVGVLSEGLLYTGPFSAGDGHIALLDSFLLYAGGHYEDFSSMELDDYPFDNTSASPWISDHETYTSPLYSLKSGSIPNDGTTDFSVIFETSDSDTLSFACKVSSEVGYDYLRFYVDSVNLQSWSGEKDWNRYSYSLGPGIHEVTWSYQKDQSMSRGKDAAWLDDVVFPVSAFRKSDLSLMKIIQPVSNPWLTHEEQVKLLVRNTGIEPIDGFTAFVSIDEQYSESESFAMQVLPGEEAEITVSKTFDLSEVGIHRVLVEIVDSSDCYMGNNQLGKDVERIIFPDLSLSMFLLDQLDGIKAEAIIDIENEGNTRIDSFRFEIWLDGNLNRSGSRFMGLKSGEVARDTFILADRLTSQLTTGFHDYLIKTIVRDSIRTNDEVSGVLYWHSLGLNPHETASGLLLYPNPATDGFHLILPQPAGQAMKVALVKIDGQVEEILVIEKGSNQLYFPISLPPGNYMLKIAELQVTIPLVITD